MNLRTSIDEAIAAGRWYVDSQWCRNSVHFYMHELLVVIEQLTADGSAGVDVLTERICGYFEDNFQRHAPFNAMCHFSTLLEALDKLAGAKPSGIRKILIALSKTTRAEPTQISFAEVDVVDRNLFWQSQLWLSFSEHTFKLLMAQAKSAFVASPTDDAWQTHVKTAASIRPVSEGLLATAKWALKLFASVQPQAEQLCDLVVPPATGGEPKLTAVLKFAQDFGPA